MYGHMDPELAAQFPQTPSYQEYAENVLAPFAEFYRDREKKPALFTEPGTTLVSKYVDFLAQVKGIKTVRGKTFVLTDCSFHNLGETCQMKNLPIRVFHNADGGPTVRVENASFVGYTCLEQDVVYHEYSGEIALGDYIEFGNVGGYSIVDKPPFILPNCQMIETDGEKTSLIKRQETMSDIFQTFIF